jgi:Mlc titration factor MtfA (ptsG expression regulator)
MNYVFVILSLGLLVLVLINSFKKGKPVEVPRISPRRAHRLLMNHVRFYKSLNADERTGFRRRAMEFLDTVRITATEGVELRMLDRIYIASAAIIPVFRYPDWTYRNLNEVIIQPGNFSKDFRGGPEDETVMGMVGDGAMHRTMVISIDALRTGFEQQGRSNTGIHESVHLLDKSDGAVDGIPEALLPDDLTDSWLEYMRSAIQEMRAGNSDINPYGATSEAEFFAVVSEYYFQRPVYLKEKHPQLHELLEAIYTADTDAAVEKKEA